MFYHTFLRGADIYLFVQGGVYHHTRYGKRPIPKFYQPNSESNGMFVLWTFTLSFCAIDLICGTIFDYVIHFRIAKAHERP